MRPPSLLQSVPYIISVGRDALIPPQRDIIKLYHLPTLRPAPRDDASIVPYKSIFMFVFETPTFAQIQGAAVSIAYCGILSSGVAYTLQIVGQKELDHTIASMAMCMESVFSALAGWLILGQTISGVELAGCALMFAAIIGAQIPEKVRS